LLLTPRRLIVTPTVGGVAQAEAAVNVAAAESEFNGVGVTAVGVVPAVERETVISLLAEAVPWPVARMAQIFNDRPAGAVIVSASVPAAMAAEALVTV
jgi:predicted ATPase